MSANKALSALIEETALLQPFTRLGDSAVWTISAEWWQGRDLNAFLEDGIPHLVTSDGSISDATAEVIRARRQGVNRPIAIVELGPGSGVFARLLCLGLQGALAGPLYYVALDTSEAMLESVAARMFADLPGVQVITQVLEPGAAAEALAKAVAATLPEGADVCFCANYALDSMPATVLRQASAGGTVEELALELRQPPDGRPFYRSRWEAPAPVHPLMPYMEADLAAPGRAAVFNHVAVGFLAALAAAVPRLDAVFVNDYPTPSQFTLAEPVQSFSGSFACGLNFGFLDRAVAGMTDLVPHAPDRANDKLSSRGFFRGGDAVYSAAFSLDRTHQAHGWGAVARKAAERGEMHRALAAYETALELAPLNWSLVTEAAGFVLSRCGRAEAAMELARAAVRLNPVSVAALRVLASAAARAGDLDLAFGTAEQGCALTRKDPGLLLDLAEYAARTGRMAQMADTVAEALALDPSNPVRARLESLRATHAPTRVEAG